MIRGKKRKKEEIIQSPMWGVGVVPADLLFYEPLLKLGGINM